MAERTTKFGFTPAKLDKLESPPKGRKWYFDERQPGLALAVTPTSKKYYFCGRVGGRILQRVLGPFPGMSLDDARHKVHETYHRVAEGQSVESAAPRSTTTFAGVFQAWIADVRHRKKTWSADVRKYDRHLSAWGEYRMADITQDHVRKMHNRVREEHGLYEANRTLSIVKTVFKFAIERTSVDYTGPSPALGVRKFPEETRDRFLLPDERERFFSALAKQPDPWRDFFLLLLCTGVRRGNLAAMMWSDVDWSSACWRIPETKNGDPQVIPLIAEAISVLKSRHVVANSRYVFPATRGDGHIIDPRKAWASLLKEAEIGNLRMHDLRRSLGSYLAMAGVSLHVIGQTLGHKDPRSTQIYARIQNETKRRAIETAIGSMSIPSELTGGPSHA